MCDLDSIHPGHGFAKHKGCHTENHVNAIRKCGPLDIHRGTFAPMSLIA